MGTTFECTKSRGDNICVHKVKGEAKFERTKLTVNIMYALYAYIHYILMLLAYFFLVKGGQNFST